MAHGEGLQATPFGEWPIRLLYNQQIAVQNYVKRRKSIMHGVMQSYSNVVMSMLLALLLSLVVINGESKCNTNKDSLVPRPYEGEERAWYTQ